MRCKTIHGNFLPVLKTEYNAIHEDFRYAAQSALTGFQESMFKEYLEAELRAFKDAAGAFAKAQSERLGELQVYVHRLLARVRAQHAQLYDSFQTSHRRFEPPYPRGI